MLIHDLDRATTNCVHIKRTAAVSTKNGSLPQSTKIKRFLNYDSELALTENSSFSRGETKFDRSSFDLQKTPKLTSTQRPILHITVRYSLELLEDFATFDVMLIQ